jgi:arsenite-transporting ATPase
MRIILFTGKGGVGKTTIAAATAIDAASKGLKTLVISTDPAHSLSDALSISLGPEPIKIGENLWAQELDLYYSMQKYWGNLRSLMLTVFRWQGVEKVLAEELSAIPGMEEGSAFMWIEKYYSENQFDVLIIDSAPTGETLTLLTLPQVTKWWVSKAFPMQNFAIKTIGKGIRKTTGVPLDKGYEELQNLFTKLEKIHQIFSDENTTSMRIVANPEKMVINESKRAFTYLQLYGYNVDAIILNRILPPEAESPFFSQYFTSQKSYIEDVELSFAPLPILKVEHAGKEIFGIELLQNISKQLYKHYSSTEVLYKEKPYKISEIKNGYRLEIKLAFAEEPYLKVNKFGDELVIELNNRRQIIFLPRFAHFMKMNKHHFINGKLIIELIKTEQ